MRFSKQQAIIRTSVAENFGADAGVWLFGSRVDDHKRGGDIDLYIESASENAAQLINGNELKLFEKEFADNSMKGILISRLREIMEMRKLSAYRADFEDVSTMKVT